MKIQSRTLLKTIFTMKGNLDVGIQPKPRVFDGIEIAPFRDNAAASVSISADFEQNWAFRAWPQEVRDQNGVTERKNVPNIVRILEEYSIPITWATVGHLFLESCDRGASGKAHPTMPRPLVNGRFQGDWYMHDPCSNVSKDPLWYAPDLIQEIIDSKVPHEMGTHTFSHFDFRLQYSTEELVQREIEACKKAMEPFGVQPRSLVFPHNECEYSYAKQLFDLDIIALRHRDPKVRLSYPERLETGNYRVYESMNLRSTRRYDYLDKVQVFVEEAIKRGAAYHIFFHPSDPSELFTDEFLRIVKYFHQERARRRVWVTTMSNLVAYCEARETTKVETRKSHNQIDIILKSTLNKEKFGTPEITLLIPCTALPQKALIERHGDLQEMKTSQFYVDQQKQKLLVNVLPSAKMLRLVF